MKVTVIFKVFDKAIDLTLDFILLQIYKIGNTEVYFNI
jgi:hypothetical protein